MSAFGVKADIAERAEKLAFDPLRHFCTDHLLRKHIGVGDGRGKGGVSNIASPVTPDTSAWPRPLLPIPQDKNRVATMLTIPSAAACMKMVLTFAAVSLAGYSLLPLIGY